MSACYPPNRAEMGEGPRDGGVPLQLPCPGRWSVEAWRACIAAECWMLNATAVALSLTHTHALPTGHRPSRLDDNGDRLSITLALVRSRN